MSRRHAKGPEHSATWREVHAFRLARHHLASPAPGRALATVVRDMCGAQAQLLGPAQLSITARVRGLSAADVSAALQKRTLVRAACMRRTLFLVPTEDLAMFVRGTARRARKELTWAINKGVAELTLDRVIDATLATLDQPLTRAEIAERVCRRLRARPRTYEGGGWGNRRRLVAVPVGHLSYPVVNLLDLAAARGVVCYGPDHDREPTFVRADAWLPGFRDCSSGEAEAWLLRAYLRSFGPATEADFALWAGITTADARRTWSDLDTAIVPVDVEGRPGGMLRLDLPDLARGSLAGPTVRLLPAFDTYLLGHRNREHLAPARDHPRIYRPAGWVSPVVLVDGRVVAVWEQSRQGDALTLRVRAFGRLSKTVVDKIRAQTRRLAAALETREVSLQTE